MCHHDKNHVIWLVVGIPTYPFEKSWSEWKSVGMMTFHSIPNCFWKVMSSSHVPVTTILFIYIYLMVKYTIKTGNVPIGWSSCSPSPPWDLAWQKLPGGACELPGDDEVRRWHEDTWFRQGKSSGFFWGKSRGNWGVSSKKSGGSTDKSGGN